MILGAPPTLCAGAAVRPRPCPGGSRRHSRGGKQCPHQAAMSAAGNPAGVGGQTASLLAEEAVVWAAQHGLLVAAAQEGTFTHAPLSLLPTPVPRAAFVQAVQLAAPFAELMAAVAGDGAFLQSTLAGACASDEFTRRLMQLYEETHSLHADLLELALLRSDYMVDEPTGALLQVEINTISASFASLSALTSAMHMHLVTSLGLQAACPPDCMPANHAMAGMAGGLAAAWTAAGHTDGVVLFVVQPGERNMFDQQWLQTTLRDAHGIRTVRRTLAEIDAMCTIGKDGLLTVGSEIASVVYFRAGYTPVDFPTEAEWRGRTLIERSASVKCPSLGWHLAGAKKVQQELARPGVVERFVSADNAAMLRSSFAGLWALDDGGAAAAIEAAIEDPLGYVLKPQREGGGNNLYGDDMVNRLRDGSGLGAFILMQRIQPQKHRALFMRQGKVTASDALCELGIYSVYLGRRGKPTEALRNDAVGHLLRTKTANSNEGGVAAGFAVLDSPLLTE